MASLVRHQYKAARLYIGAADRIRMRSILFTCKIRRAFFKKGGDAFFEIVGFAGFDLAFVFEFELLSEAV